MTEELLVTETALPEEPGEVQIAVIGQHLDRATALGPGDAELGALAVFYRSGWGLASAAVELGVPVGDEARGLGDGELAVEPSLRVAAHIAAARVHALIGAELSGDDVGFESAVAVEYPVGRSVLSFEVVGEIADDAALWLVPGWSWVGLAPVDFGVGAVFGAVGDTASWGGLAKFVVEL